MVLAEKESLLVSVIYSEIENRIVVKVGGAAQAKGVYAGKLVQELARAMYGSGGGQQHFAQGGGGNAVKFKAVGPTIRKELESQIH
jgi:alanyl-tRNA synthetase